MRLSEILIVNDEQLAKLVTFMADVSVILINI